ncbi:Amino acid adenylation domain protein [uncultured Alphaproteobacteria bacterium]|uniref:Amino acid adenylation domain protein n=1 Tax=uncultured Alphaproteobacteria bacterium TaxID=91750 RepID=A0A212J0R4_9PROT|nr:Amino acid adenylation domain protein [uncultured Alphaproteobacteria bacterium]
MEETVPLTSCQKELWLASQASRYEYAETTIWARFIVDDAVIPAIFEEAIRRSLRHTTLLSASLCETDETPYFVMGSHPEPDFRYRDVSGEADPDAAEAALEDAFFEEPVEDRLIRHMVVRTGPELCIILVKSSHLILDGMGMMFHMAFLGDIYTALIHGREPDLGEPCSSLAAYEEDQAHLSSARFDKDMAFWERHLECLQEKRIFRPRPGHPDLLGQTRHKRYELDADVSRDIDAALARFHTSPAVYFAALHALFVGFLCDEKNVVVQTPVGFGERRIYARRQGAQIGMPPLALDLGRFDSFPQLIDEIAQQNGLFFRHIRTPYQLAMRRMANRDFSAIADTFINFLPNTPGGTPDFKIRVMSQRHSAREPVLFGTMVLQDPHTHCFSLTVRSSANHLSEQDVERYVKRFAHVTRQLLAGVDLADLDFLLEEEAAELALWQQGERRPYPILTLPELFDAVAARFGDRAAVRDEQGATLSYARLAENSRRAATWLTGQGVAKGDVVAVLAERTPDLAEIVLGILRVGAVYLPVDPKAPADRLAYILADSSAKIRVPLGQPAYGELPMAPLAPVAAPTDAAYLIYTSGSTGKPKGVLAPHGGFANMIQGQIERFGVEPSDRVLLFAPPVFDASLSEMFMALLSGACLYPVSDSLKNAPWDLKRYMAEQRISVVTFPPSYLSLFEREPFEHLGVLITAGEPPIADDALHYAKSLRYFNAYGPTETCVCATLAEIAADARPPLGVGRPLPNLTVSVRGVDRKPLPAGIVGEVWVGGPGVALGYHNNPELTERRFVVLPDRADGPSYATGDLAQWSEDGEILLVGRADDQVKVRGNRVELGEVAYLLERSEGIAQAAVLDIKGRDDRTELAAFVVLRADTTLDAAIDWSRDHLPSYMVPTVWRQLDAMPLGSTGKIDRNALKRQAESRSGDARRTASGADDLRLLPVCRRILGKDYDPAVNFFAQGGDSLKGMRLLREIRKAFGVAIPFRLFAACNDLFELEKLLQTEDSEVRAAISLDRAPLNPGQFQIWAYQQANDRAIDYNMPLLLEVRGPRADDFVTALTAAVNEQELFSCTIGGDIDDPYFARDPKSRIEVRTLSLSREDAPAFFDEQIHTPFDLTREAPVRLLAVRLPDSVQVLLLIHHIVGDGETIDLLLRNALGRLDRQASTRGLLATQADSCVRERSYRRSPDWGEDAVYWRERLDPPVPRLTHATRRHGAMIPFPLSAARVDGLERFARENGTTVLPCFVAVLARRLGQVFARDEMLIGVPIGMRESPAEFNTAGFYVNTLPLRLSSVRTANLTESVAKAAEAFRGALAHSRHRVAATPEILATHTVSAPIEGPGVAAERLPLELRASKFAASFILQTGENAGIYLEYDRDLIPDAAALLEQLARDIDQAIGLDAPARLPSEILTEAWCDILHCSEAPTEDSDFFKEGGESIKAIQITGLLHRHGLTRLTAPDFMRTPRFGDLCRALNDAPVAAAPQAPAVYAPIPPGRTVPLLPFQRHFIRTHAEQWLGCHMMLPMEIDTGVPVATVEGWLAGLPACHQALRMAFGPTQAVMLAQPRPVRLHRAAFGADVPLTEIFRAAARAIIATLDPTDGRTLGVALYEQGERRYLLAIGHHMALDVLSMEVLRRSFVQYLRSGRPSPEVHGVATRALHMQALVETGRFPSAEDHAFWADICAAPQGVLVGLAPREDDRRPARGRDSFVTEIRGYRPEQTNSVLCDMLASLAAGLHRIGQREAISVALESHGRDERLPGLDVSGAMGWFTAICPMPLAPSRSCSEARRRVFSWLRDHFNPADCNAYVYLRDQDPVRFDRPTQITFNYLGKHDSWAESGAASLMTTASPGMIPELLDPASEPDSPVEITIFLDGEGTLQVGIYYNPRLLSEHWVRTLFDAWHAAIRTLPGFMPDEQRDALYAACGVGGEEIERIVLPDPCHEPILYQSLLPGRKVYTQQINLFLRGPIDEFRLAQAWPRVVNRHESLRSLFPMLHDGAFHRVVRHQARTSVECHDLSHLAADDSRAILKDLLEARRERPLDLQKGPLLTAQIVRLDAETVVMSWYFHHVLMDGWCMGILLDEMLALQADAPKPLPKPFDLSDYSEWRLHFDEDAARAYWASLLDGFPAPTGVGGRSVPPGDRDPEILTLALDEPVCAALKARARQHGVTLSVLIEAVWGVVLGALNGGRRDVVFGIVSAGRPAELPGIDRAVGLFIQSIPVRVRWQDGDTLADMLARLKPQSQQQMRYGYLQLAEIGKDLIDHAIAFENYPLNSHYLGGTVELFDVQGYEKGPYPLGISVIARDVIDVRFCYDPVRLEREQVQELSDRLAALLRRVAEDDDAGAAALETLAAGRTLAQAAPVAVPPPAEALRETAAEPQPSSDDDAEIRQVVQDCYESALDCKIGSIDDDFFLLGGHSLKAMRVLAQLHQRLSADIGIEDILAHSSIRKLSERILAARRCSTAVIPRVSTEGSHALSPAQRRIWFLQHLHDDDRVYRIPFAARLAGPVDPERLQQALRLLEERHDALRLRVSVEAPEQHLAPPGGLRLEVHDGPGDDAVDELRIPLGIDNPLVRVALYRPDDPAPMLLIAFHHIMFDGWSAEILTRELNDAYEAVGSGKSPDWQPLHLDYLSYVAWDANRIVPAARQQIEALRPLPERLALPLDFTRPAAQSFDGKVITLDLDATRGQALKHWAAEAETTAFTLLLALVKAFLFRHTGQSDLIVGCPSANREIAETQSLVGLFANTVVVRTRFDPDQDFDRLLATCHRGVQTALAAQDYPFERLIEDVGAPRDAARNPLFDVFVSLEDAAWAVWDRAPLGMEPIPLPHQSAKFDLSFYFRERADGGYRVDIEYATALFRESTIRTMGERLATLADAALRRDRTPVARLGLLPAHEQALLASFNATREACDLEGDADRRFRRQCLRTPDATALIEADGTRWTYAQFDRMVERLAARLQGFGIGHGDPVGVCFPRSRDMMVAIYAVLRRGAVYVPLAENLPEARLRAMLDDLGQAPIVCAEGNRARLEALGLAAITPPEDGADDAAATDPSEAVGDSLAYVIFTSGSTGRPKGVAIEHRSLANRLLWMQSRFPIGVGDVVLQKTTVSFDVSVWELLWWSWTGAAVALLDPGAEKDPARIVRAVERHGVTVVHFVPSMLRAFLDHLEAYAGTADRLRSLKTVFASGEALPRELVARFNAMLNADLHNLYGPTEATIDVSWQPCRETPAENRAVAIGRPIANTRLYLLDRLGQPVPVGVTGEIHIAGVQVARGYVNRKALTDASFTADPFQPGERMYRTGDLGRWCEDGCVEYLGRNDDQVKVRGFRIELGEVEVALLRCEGIAQAVVRPWRVGDGDALEAFVLPKPGARLSAQAIRSGLLAMVPDYMCPSRFLLADEIPLTPSGKADRKNLVGHPLDGVSGAVAPTAESATEVRVRALWQQVMPEVHPGVEQGFFDAGGNSLLLVQLHALMERHWPRLFTLAGLFSDSSIKAQAARIDRRRAAPAPAEAPAASDAAVAIVGMAVRFGDYEDCDRFWRDLASATDLTTQMPERRRAETRQLFEAAGLEFDPARIREAAYLADVSSFDYRRFGLSPNDAGLLDPWQRLFLDTALRALDDAGYGGASLQDRKVGTFVGASPLRLFQNAATRAFPDQAEQIYLLNVPSNVVARLSHIKNWSGPAAMVDTACSSSLTALHQACRSLRNGECEAALVGGAHIVDLPLKGERTFTIEAASGRTRTFDADADGVGAGEGAAVFLLKRLDRAVADHDPIHAVILGSAVNQDGKASSMAAPNPEAQARVIAEAARSAGIGLDEIDLFEAHGTATALGDPIEIEALSRAFALSGATPTTKAPIGSVKGNLGHLDAAAGAAGLAKAVLCLQRGQAAPQPHFRQPNPHIDFDRAPVRVARELQPLPPSARPWRAGVSAFGLSGVNAHVVLSGPTAESFPDDDGRWLCLPFSAPDEASLAAYAADILDAVRAHPGWPLHAIAATLIAGRDALPTRAAVVARSRDELIDRLAEGPTPAANVKRRSATVAAGGWAERDAAERAAQAFLSGQSLGWPEDRPLYRLHLPPTPLARVPLWPRFPARLLSDPLDTPAGQAFTVAIDREDFWPVAEHRVGGIPTLVGMGVLELIAAAVPHDPLQIDDLRWQKLLTAEDGSRATLLVAHAAEGDGNAARVALHHCRGDRWNVAVSATAMPASARAGARLDLGRLRQGLRPVTEEGPTSAIAVGARWDCREALWCDPEGTELLGRLVLPPAFADDLTRFRWHPAMVDVAASLALYGRSGFVPAACRSVRLYRPLPARVFAHVTVTERSDLTIGADCRICDDDGQILVELLGLLFLTAAPATSHPKETGADLHRLVWEPMNVPSGVPRTAGSLLLLDDGENRDPLTLALESQASSRRPLPRRAEDRQAVAGAVVAQGIRRIAYRTAADEQPWWLPDLLRRIVRAAPTQPLHVTAIAPFPAEPSACLATGPLLCLPLEEPAITAGLAYLEAVTDTTADALIASLGEITGVYRIDDGGGLSCRRLAANGEASGRTAIRADLGAVVISGGTGGIGLTLAGQIRHRTGATVVLLHRRESAPADLPFPTYRCDVTDRAEVARTFAAIRREFGPIQGVIHAAGIAGNGYLASRTEAEYRAVLAPKTEGTRNLHDETLNDRLSFFVLASSRTALTGAPGQSDYAAANAYLNAFAGYRRRLGLPATALCWNAWAKVGMAARHGIAEGAGASSLFDPDQAFDLLSAALASSDELLAVATPEETVATWRSAQVKTGAAEPPVASTPAAGQLGDEILEILRDGLGYDATPSRDDDFFDLGGDSIAATQIVARITQSLGLPATVAELMESRSLGEFLDRVTAGSNAPSAPETPPVAPPMEKYPVGREQLAILYADAANDGGLGFNLPVFMVMPDDLDRDRLEAALAALIRRHEVLRTSFCDFEAERPNMIVHPFDGFTLEEVRLPDLSGKDALITPFDLRRERGFRAKLLRPDVGPAVLYLDVHHALADGRTMSLLNADLYKLYHGRPLAPVDAQQKDLAWAEITRPDDEAKRYWQNLYAGDLPVLDLPSQYVRPPIHTGRGALHEFALSADLVQAINALARREKMTNYHVVLSAWAILAASYAQRDDLVIGVSVDGRGLALNSAGMMASLLPLRLRVAPGATMRDLLHHCRDRNNEAMKHRAYVLNDLLMDLKPKARPERSPLSEIILSYMNFEFGGREDTLFETLRFDKRASKTDLSIFVSDTGSEIGFALEYYADLFDADDIRRMADDLIAILADLTGPDPDRPLSLRRQASAKADLGRIETTIDQARHERIARLARRASVSEAAVLLATFAGLMARVQNVGLLAVGLPGGETARFTLDDATEFDDLLRNAEAALTAHAKPAAADAAGLAFSWRDGADDGEDRADTAAGLACRVEARNGRLTVRFVFDTHLHDEPTVRNWLGYFDHFLDGITEEICA